MSNLSEKYSKILLDIESHIKDPQEKKYVSKKVNELSSIYIELIDRLTKFDNERIEKLESQQDKIINNLSKIQDTVSLIKNDIYEDDIFDFEIVCPYCNHEFVADIDEELREEVECPECHNTIELDWDGEEESCSGCSGGHCHHAQGTPFMGYQIDEEENDEDDM